MSREAVRDTPASGSHSRYQEGERSWSPSKSFLGRERESRGGGWDDRDRGGGRGGGRPVLAAIFLLLAVAVTAVVVSLYTNGRLSVHGAMQLLPTGDWGEAGISPELAQLRKELAAMRRRIQEEDAAEALMAEVAHAREQLSSKKNRTATRAERSGKDERVDLVLQQLQDTNRRLEDQDAAKKALEERLERQRQQFEDKEREHKAEIRAAEIKAQEAALAAKKEEIDAAVAEESRKRVKELLAVKEEMQALKAALLGGSAADGGMAGVGGLLKDVQKKIDDLKEETLARARAEEEARGRKEMEDKMAREIKTVTEAAEAKLKSELRRAEDDADAKLRTELRRCNDDADERVRDQVSKVREDLEEAKQEAAAAVLTAVERAATIDSLEKQLADARSNRDAAIEVQEDAERLLKELKEKVKELEGVRDSQHEEKKTLEKRVKELEEEEKVVKGLKELEEELKRKELDLKKQVEELEEKVKELQEEGERRDKELTEKDEQLTKVTEELETKGSAGGVEELAECKKELQDTEEQMREQLKVLRDRAKDLGEKLQQERKLKTAAEQEAKAAKEEAGTCKQDAAKPKGESPLSMQQQQMGGHPASREQQAKGEPHVAQGKVPQREASPQTGKGSNSAGGGARVDKNQEEAIRRWEEMQKQDPKLASSASHKARMAGGHALAGSEEKAKGKREEDDFCKRIAGEHAVFDPKEGGCRCESGFMEDDEGRCVPGAGGAAAATRPQRKEAPFSMREGSRQEGVLGGLDEEGEVLGGIDEEEEEEEEDVKKPPPMSDDDFAAQYAKLMAARKGDAPASTPEKAPSPSRGGMDAGEVLGGLFDDDDTQTLGSLD